MKFKIAPRYYLTNSQLFNKINMQMKQPLKMVIVLSFILCFFNLMNSQPEKGRFIQASIGLGSSFALDESEVYGSGFYAQGEYIFGFTKWFGVRPYAGFIVTDTDENEKYIGQEYAASSAAFLIGAKFRLAAPIPYVAPFVETGIGASLGSFKTITPFTNKEKSGIIPHIPLTLGLAIGKRHRLELALCYYFHTTAEHATGIAAIGYTFPLN